MITRRGPRYSRKTILGNHKDKIIDFKHNLDTLSSPSQILVTLVILPPVVAVRGRRVVVKNGGQAYSYEEDDEGTLKTIVVGIKHVFRRNHVACMTRDQNKNTW